MQNLFQNIESIMTIMQLLSLVVVTIVFFLKTGDKKIIKEFLQTMKEFRTESYKDNSKPTGLTFEKLKPVYRLNKATNELEMTDEVIDIDEVVNSAVCTTLESVLDRLMPTSVIDEQTVVYNNMVDDLDYMQDVSQMAESYKKLYNLDSKLSIQEVMAFIKTKATDTKNLIDSEVAKKENIKKEVLKDEKKKETE